jgi:hypothetical protein
MERQIEAKRTRNGEQKAKTIMEKKQNSRGWAFFFRDRFGQEVLSQSQKRDKPADVVDFPYKDK